MLWKLTAATLLLFAMMTAVVIYSGVFIVDVRNLRNGHRFFLPVPMIAINGPLSILPDAAIHDIQIKFGKPLSYLNAAVGELVQCPDTEIIRVDTPTEQVNVEKKGDYILVGIRGTDAEVRLRIPVAATARAVSLLARTD